MIMKGGMKIPLLGILIIIFGVSLLMISVSIVGWCFDLFVDKYICNDLFCDNFKNKKESYCHYCKEVIEREKRSRMN